MSKNDDWKIATHFNKNENTNEKIEITILLPISRSQKELLTILLDSNPATEHVLHQDKSFFIHKFNKFSLHLTSDHLTPFHSPNKSQNQHTIKNAF